MTKIKCRKCGKVFPFEDIVCPKCGYDITEDEENVQIRDIAYVKQLKNLKREKERAILEEQGQKIELKPQEEEQTKPMEVRKYNPEEAWKHRNELHLEKDVSGMTRVHIPLSTMLIITVIMIVIIIIAAYLK